MQNRTEEENFNTKLRRTVLTQNQGEPFPYKTVSIQNGGEQFQYKTRVNSFNIILMRTVSIQY